MFCPVPVSPEQAALMTCRAALQQIQKTKEPIRKTYPAAQHTWDKDPGIIEQLFDTITEVLLRYNVLKPFHRGFVGSKVPVIGISTSALGSSDDNSH